MDRRPKYQFRLVGRARASLAAALALGAFLLVAIVGDAPSAVAASGTSARGGAEQEQQVILVTGSTSGLGREVALRLAAQGAHVIVHGRSRERGEAVVEEIARQGGSARFYRADLASFAQVRELAHTILRDYDRLDVLVNNAGFGSAPDERLLSEDGHEFRFQVNYLSGFLLTRLLLPRLRESAPSRIVNVSSLAQVPIDFDDVMIENRFSGGRAYAQSKLAQVMFTFDLAEELEGTGIMVNSLHPATYMPTGMVLRLGVEPRATIAEGADAVMQLITSDEIEAGQFFRGLEPARANAQAYDLDARSRLKALSEELTGVGAQTRHGTTAVIETDLGAIVVELDSDQAPRTTTNFLRYIDAGLYRGGSFYRSVRQDNQPEDDVRIEVIQGGIDRNRRDDAFDPIRMEGTGATGLHHVDGTISMARGGVDTARGEFFICVGDQPELDEGGRRNPDGRGFAAFGRVVAGMEVVRRIHRQVSDEQTLVHPVIILEVRTTERADPGHAPGSST